MNLGKSLVVLLISLSASELLAHKPSDSYLRLSPEGETLELQWDIALKDLEFLLGIDSNQDGQITWGEVHSQRQQIAEHALQRLTLQADGKKCRVSLQDLLVSRHSDGAYAHLICSSDAPARSELIQVNYRLLFDVDPTHRGLLLYTQDGLTATHVLSPERPSTELRPGHPQVWSSLAEYIGEGVWHIWKGFDHVLFLLSLLLPSVLVRREGKWHEVEHLRPVLWSVLKIVSMFTLAHSITLWLAVMGYVALPSRLVEASIALSIVVTALNNFYPVLPLSGWAMAFGFGLVHGFGFANVLIDLGLSNLTLAVSLLGFNVGVELGQVVIVLCFMPLAFLLRNTYVYQRGVFVTGSLVIAVVAGLWTCERLCNVEIIGF